MGTRNSNQNVGYGTSIGYHCCSMDGSKGDRAGCKTNGAYTYDEAVANCAAFGKRLCTREEVLANKGTGTGCNFDGFLVWTSTPCTDSSQWRKGVAGATCDETCGAIGMRCDSSTQSTIRSCEDIAAVASQVGESCVGCTNIRHKTYIPQCQNDARFYQPCQCETIDTLTAAICYCVDKYGDMLDGKVDVVVKDDWQGTCSKLGCGGEIASKY